MIRQTFNLPKYDWQVCVYYAVTGYNIGEIMNSLIRIDCTGDDLDSAHASLSSGKMDTGLTFSNERKGKTVIVIQMTSSTKEFLKSLRHEVGHLSTHISEAYGIDPYGEEIQYIGDAIIDEMWDVAKHFLCDDCREGRIRRILGRQQT